MLQVGLVVANRGRILGFADDPKAERYVRWLSRNAMSLFLWHTVGFALFYAATRMIFDIPEEPNTLWWVTRPLWIVGPALATIPLIAVTRGKRRPA